MYSHDGKCGLCGTDVDKEYTICTGCQAEWQEKPELLLFWLKIPLGLVLALTIFDFVRGAPVDSGEIVGTLFFVYIPMTFINLGISGFKGRHFRRAKKWHKPSKTK